VTVNGVEAAFLFANQGPLKLIPSPHVAEVSLLV
jgi:hypothetical protein